MILPRPSTWSNRPFTKASRSLPAPKVVSVLPSKPPALPAMMSATLVSYKLPTNPEVNGLPAIAATIPVTAAIRVGATSVLFAKSRICFKDNWSKTFSSALPSALTNTPSSAPLTVSVTRLLMVPLPKSVTSIVSSVSASLELSPLTISVYSPLGRPFTSSRIPSALSTNPNESRPNAPVRYPPWLELDEATILPSASTTEKLKPSAKLAKFSLPTTITTSWPSSPIVKPRFMISELPATTLIRSVSLPCAIGVLLTVLPSR